MSALASFEDLATVIKQQMAGPLEAWVMPWHYGIVEPYNPISNHTYTGNNAIALLNSSFKQGFVSVEWATLRAWSKKGVRVRRGAKATIIHVPLFGKSKAKQPKEEERIRGFRTLSVFNGDQIAGYDENHPDLFEQFQNKPSIESFIRKCNARITYHRGDAYYVKETDRIYMPHKANFVGSTHAPADHNFYATIIHELIHWTGHPDRLNRESLIDYQNESRALEELIAELGTALICARFDNKIQPRTDHAAYLKSWLTGLDEELYLGNAFKQAQVAIHYLYELTGNDIRPLSSHTVKENHESVEITKDDVQQYDQVTESNRYAEFKIIQPVEQAFISMLRVETKCLGCSQIYTVTLVRHESVTTCPRCFAGNHHLLEW